MKKETEMELDRFKEECVFISYEMSRRSNFARLDLHGLYLDEAEEVVFLVIEKIK